MFLQLPFITLDEKDEFHEEWQSKAHSSTNRRSLANNTTHSSHPYQNNQPHHNQPHRAIDSKFETIVFCPI